MSMYYDEIQHRMFDNDWDICEVCPRCNRLVCAERSTQECEDGSILCNTCFEETGAKPPKEYTRAEWEAKKLSSNL